MATTEGDTIRNFTISALELEAGPARTGGRAGGRAGEQRSPKSCRGKLNYCTTSKYCLKAPTKI